MLAAKKSSTESSASKKFEPLAAACQKAGVEQQMLRDWHVDTEQQKVVIILPDYRKVVFSFEELR